LINTVVENLELVIFDVDGTLYDQSKLRSKMFLALLSYYSIRPWRFSELFILYYFRKEREKRAGTEVVDLQNQQFIWCAEKTNYPIEKIKAVVEKWIFNFPNKYLKNCMYSGLDTFFCELRKNKVLIAIYSDYDAVLKMQHMDLRADLLVSSTDEDINAMKPMPNGLNYILSALEIKNKTNCIFIGDRQELDGKCAELAGVPFLLINKQQAKNNFYKSLSKTLLNVS